MFGLPSLLIGFLFYTLCTAEPDTGDYDAIEEDEYFDENDAYEQQAITDTAKTPPTTREKVD